MERAEYLLNEGIAVQREVSRVIEAKREVLSEVERTNYDFNNRL
jgi:hypothetical protein